MCILLGSRDREVMISNGYWKPSADIADVMSANCGPKELQKIGRDLVDGSLWLDNLVHNYHRNCRRVRLHQGQCSNFLDDMLDPFLTNYALTCIATKERSRDVTDREAKNHSHGLVNFMVKQLGGHAKREDTAKVIVAARRLTFGIVGQTLKALDLTYLKFVVPYHNDLICKVFGECR